MKFLPHKPSLAKLCFIIFFSILLISACQNLPLQYKPNIEQGNIIDQEKIDQIKIGMTTEQVKFLLGNPVMANPLYPQEWVYYYKFVNGAHVTTKQQKLTLKFNENNQLEEKNSE